VCGDDVSAKEGLLLRWSAVCVDDVSAKEGLLLRWSAVCVDDVSAKEGLLLRWSAVCVVDVSITSCSGSNHYGIAGWYAIRAAKEGLIVSKCRCVCVRTCMCVYV